MKKQIVPVLVLAGLCLGLLHGCKTVGPKFQLPKIDTPAGFRTVGTDQTQADLKWWELFRDPVLAGLVRIALDNNPDLRIAASRIQEARANLGFTRADEYPSIDLTAGGSMGNFSGARSRDTNKTVYIAPMFKWEIDFWGRYRHASQAARAEILASEYGRRALEITLISQVAQAYYQLIDYHQRLAISKETLASRMDSLHIIRQRFDKGVIPEIDLNQAQIQKEMAAGAIPRYERLIAKAEQALNLLLGRLPQKIPANASLASQPAPPTIPAGMPAALLERRPDLRQYLEKLRAQNERVGVAVAQKFPSISLTAGLGLASSELSSITNQGGIWTLGGSLLAPLFDRERRERRVEIEEERTRQALIQYEKAALTAFAEVEDALMEVRTYGTELASSRRKVRAAENAAMLSFERYDKGVSSFLEVLDSERTLFDAKLELSQIKQQFFNAHVSLYKALGGGWTDPAQDRAERS